MPTNPTPLHHCRLCLSTPPHSLAAYTSRSLPPHTVSDTNPPFTHANGSKVRCQSTRMACVCQTPWLLAIMGLLQQLGGGGVTQQVLRSMNVHTHSTHTPVPAAHLSKCTPASPCYSPRVLVQRAQVLRECSRGWLGYTCSGMPLPPPHPTPQKHTGHCSKVVLPAVHAPLRSCPPPPTPCWWLYRTPAC